MLIACPILFVPGLTPLPTVQACVRCWMSEYHSSKVPGSEGMSYVPEACDFDSYADDMEGEGDWDFPNSTGSGMGHCASTVVDYDHLLKVCSTVSPSHLKFSVNDICLTLGCVPAVPDHPADDTRLCALEATSKTSSFGTISLESQIASKDAEILLNVAKADAVEGRLPMTEEGESLISVTTHDRGPQLHAAEAPRSSAQVALRSAESPLQVDCASESSLEESLGQLQ